MYTCAQIKTLERFSKNDKKPTKQPPHPQLHVTSSPLYQSWLNSKDLLHRRIFLYVLKAIKLCSGELQVGTSLTRSPQVPNTSWCLTLDEITFHLELHRSQILPSWKIKHICQCYHAEHRIGNGSDSQLVKSYTTGPISIGTTGMHSLRSSLVVYWFKAGGGLRMRHFYSKSVSTMAHLDFSSSPSGKKFAIRPASPQSCCSKA